MRRRLLYVNRSPARFWKVLLFNLVFLFVSLQVGGQFILRLRIIDYRFLGVVQLVSIRLVCVCYRVRHALHVVSDMVDLLSLDVHDVSIGKSVGNFGRTATTNSSLRSKHTRNSILLAVLEWWVGVRVGNHRATILGRRMHINYIQLLNITLWKRFFIQHTLFEFVV